MTVFLILKVVHTDPLAIHQLLVWFPYHGTGFRGDFSAISACEFML